MSLFYKNAFKTVFFLTGLKDKKSHKRNKARPDVEVRSFSVCDGLRMNVLSSKDKKEETQPLLVDIHGGGWMYGDENLNLDFGKWFSQRGFKVALPNYSLIYDKNIREIIQQLHKQLSFLKEKKKECHLDLDNAVLVGDSAGASLAMQLVAIDSSPKLKEIYGVENLPFSFKALALYHSACYPKRMRFVQWPNFMDKGARKTFLSMYCGKEKELLSHIDFSDMVEDIAHLPPLYVLTSDGDTFLKYETDYLMADLDRHHFPYVYHCVPDKSFGHVASVTNVDGKKYEDVNDQVLQFLKSALCSSKG